MTVGLMPGAAIRASAWPEISAVWKAARADLGLSADTGLMFFLTVDHPDAADLVAVDVPKIPIPDGCSLAGFFERDPDRVWVNAAQSPAEMAMTVAHELRHLHQRRWHSASATMDEADAEVYARGLLERVAW
jgi:hypothetical protein